MDRLARHRPRVLREPEKGHGSDLPFRPGGAAYRPGPAAPPGGQPEQGSSDGDGGYQLVAVYEFCAAEYGWSSSYIDTHLTDEQFALYVEKAAKRKQQASFAELERIVSGTNWGVAIAFDPKGKTGRRWQSLRNKHHRSTGTSKGLTGKALDNAVLALAAADPSLVKFEQAGA